MNLIERIYDVPDYPFGVRIDFTNKTTEWIDPVNSISMNANVLNVDNGIAYQFDFRTIKDIEYYPICEYCGHELILYENETCLRCGN